MTTASVEYGNPSHNGLIDRIRASLGSIGLHAPANVSQADRYIETSCRYLEASHKAASPRTIRRLAKQTLKNTDENPDYLDMRVYQTMLHDPNLPNRTVEQATHVAEEHPHFEAWKLAESARPTDKLIEL